MASRALFNLIKAQLRTDKHRHTKLKAERQSQPVLLSVQVLRETSQWRPIRTAAMPQPTWPKGDEEVVVMVDSGDWLKLTLKVLARSVHLAMTVVIVSLDRSYYSAVSAVQASR